MENEQLEPLKTRKYSINFGIILGVIGIVFYLLLVSQELHYQQNPAQQIVSVVLLLAVVFVAIYQFKKANGGFLSLGQAMKIGIGVAIISTVISVVFGYIYGTFIEPDLLDRIMEYQKPVIAERNPTLTPEQIDNAIETQKKFAPFFYIIAFVINTIIASIGALIAGLIMKKAKSDY